MKFSQDFIEKVQQANSIVDIISQYTQLKSSGSGMMGRCPFPDHQEKTPSFSVSELKQVYHCFGCHKSGNIFTFLRDYQGMSFPQAIEYLADRAGIPIPQEMEPDTEADSRQKKKKELLAINKEALYFFNENLKRLPENHPVLAYIKRRNLNDEILKIFKIGYALPEWDGLCLHLKRKGLSLALAEEARLVKSKQRAEDGKYDIFRDRLIFPITNSMGEVLAFGGRIISTGEPKYLNSPETLVFQKGKIFYGLEQTARYIRSDDQIVIVEGYMDLVSLYQNGIKNVVATMGTAITSDHARIIRKLTRNVVLMFDGDSAGKEASERALSVLLEQDLYPRGLVLPDNKDPDDFIKEFGFENLKDKIDHSLDLMNLIFKSWLEDFHGEPSEKIKLANKLKKVLDYIPDTHYKQLYVQQLAPLMGVEQSWLGRIIYSQQIKTTKGPQVLANISQSKSMPSKGFEAPVFQLKKASKAEILLLALSIKSYANMKIYAEENVEEFISHEDVKKLLQEAHQVYRQSPEKFDRLTSLLISKVDDPRLLFFNDPMKEHFRSSSLQQDNENSSLITTIESSEDEQKEIEEKLLRDAIKRVRENYLKETLKQISHELKLGATPEKMERMMLIQKAIKENK
ncbi:MAG: DNA primase [Bdellovibrionales bacterium]|nr:DNA primase [Bdellovibrionales bacterium]